MNVLIYGAGNSIAIFISRYLQYAGHTAILADSNKYCRAFYSRNCKKKYIFRSTDNDKEGFSKELLECIKKEDIKLLLPTTDEALVKIIKAKEFLPKDIKVLFPLDYEKIGYILDKSNIPSICEKSGIHTAPACIINGYSTITDFAKFNPPYAIKKVLGRGGESFMKIDSMNQLEQELNKIKKNFPAKTYLVQEYILGPVYGAGGVFEDNALKKFYSYKYVRRHPYLSGTSTLCQVDHVEAIKEGMSKVLKVLEWKGYCHMDFIMEEKSGMPYLIDINPVHWYSVPNSMLKDLNCLDYYLHGVAENHTEGNSEGNFYTTVWFLRELQRIFTGGIFRKSNSTNNYWHYISGLRRSDFYWDPLPVVLTPFLKLLRRKYCHEIK